MALRSVTDGEILLDYIQVNLIGQKIVNGLENMLSFTGREEELSDFIQELVGVNTVGRIVVAGSSLTEKYHVTDPLFERELTYYLRNFFQINSQYFDPLYRFAFKAIKASKESIGDGVRRRLKQWAMSGHNFCYMCGVQLSFENKLQDIDEKRRGFTCEHIWPREYGGNSVEDNLLPCCSSCNSSKKQNFATWAMPSVQSLIRGFSPGDDCLGKIDGSHKFAIHYRFAKKFAHTKNLTLKNAFLKIGPWQDIRVINDDDVADFFNLENHAEKGRTYGI